MTHEKIVLVVQKHLSASYEPETNFYEWLRKEGPWWFRFKWLVSDADIGLAVAVLEAKGICSRIYDPMTLQPFVRRITPIDS